MDEVSIGDGIREAVFGANDGAVSTFGILAGLVGASIAGSTITLVGIVQMVAAGMSMGLGAYISTKSQNEVYAAAEQRERDAISAHPARERSQVRSILSIKGLKGRTLDAATSSLTKNRDGWAHFLLEERLGIASTSYPHPLLAGSIMFVSFVIAGFFAVVPFLLFPPQIAIIWSAVLSLLLLFAVGAAKTCFTCRSWLLSGLENLLVGAVTGVVGYSVGALVQGLI